jgi:hypothetical protein
MRTTLFILAGLIASPAAAQAAQQLALTPLRSYELPTNLSLVNAQYSGDVTGRTVISAVVGEEPAQRCAILSTTDEGARAYIYQYNGASTTCAGAVAAPDGALLVRASATLAPDTAPGVTAYLSATGELLWQLEDRALVNARAMADGGTGEFVGAWVGPHPALAYSVAHARALAFTVGALRIGQLSRELTQAHSVNPERGELLVSGQTFGANGLGTLSALLVSRQEDNDFLLQVGGEQDVGAVFYRYDGRRKIEIIRPAAQSWAERQVRPVVAAGDALALVWRPAAGDAGDWRVSLVEEGGALRWERALGPRAEAEGLGEPLAIWGSREVLVIVYLRPEGPVALVLDTRTGDTLVEEQALATLTPRSPVTIIQGADDTLVLLSLDTRTGRMHEDRLVVEEAPAGEEMGGEEMGAADMGPPEPPAEDEGCGCAAGGGGGGASTLWVVGWMAAGAARRRGAKALARRGALREDARS